MVSCVLGLLTCHSPFMTVSSVESFKKLTTDWQDAIFQWADPSGSMLKSPTRSWPLADLYTALAIAIGYLVFVFVGTIVMRRLPAQKPYGVSFIYNMMQIALCAYMSIESVIQAWRHGYHILPCEPFNAKQPPLAPVLWLFYVSKVFDFADTIFIILGKKWNQLSFLHVYHHVTIFLIYWLNLNAGYDGDIFLTVVLNGAVHMVMYTYYFLSLHTKDVWWKKYLTLFQITQFVLMNSQAIYLLAVGCKSFSPQITKLYLGYILSLLVLFLDFYFRSYSKASSRKQKAN